MKPILSVELLLKNKVVMKTENQVCTLEQAKTLSKLRIHQHSLFYWCYTDYSGNSPSCEFVATADKWISQHRGENVWAYKNSAFTAAELIKMNGGNGGIETGATKENKGKFYMQTDGFGEGNIPVFTYYNSFAEASAAKLINALENEWLDVETCNSRLLE